MGARENSLNSAIHVFKYGFAPGFSAFGLAFFNREHPYTTGVISLTFFIAATFFLSVARIRLEDNEIKYRRWFHWHGVQYSEIRECGESWVFGYIRARKYAFPWGRIYFARPYSSYSLFGWDKEIISTIRAKTHAYKVLNKGLRRRYLLFEVHHLVLLIDVTSVGPRYETIPAKGKSEPLPSLLFRSWQCAEEFLLEAGASRDDLDKARDSLRKMDVGLLETWS